MQHIAIFASGSGSNARKIIEYFSNSTDVKVALVVSNKTDAKVLQIANEFDLPNVVIDKSQLANEAYMLSLLQAHSIDYIVLAGFLLLVPKFLVESYSKKIVNIHPALLPKYGGKGMYGKYVHESVYNHHERESGITIHFASEHYDEGNIIFQKSVALSETDTPETIAQKVQQLEHEFFPAVIEKLIAKG
jgi:phosphoribosylglycinamide formyltransferase-1